MLFTEGKLRIFENMMKEIPKTTKNEELKESNDLSELTIKERDCPYCLHFDSKRKKCDQKKCVVFDT